MKAPRMVLRALLVVSVLIVSLGLVSCTHHHARRRGPGYRVRDREYSHRYDRRHGWHDHHYRRDRHDWRDRHDRGDRDDDWWDD